MELRFYEDPDTGLPHILNHGVNENEVRQILGRTVQVLMTRARHSDKQRRGVICE